MPDGSYREIIREPLDSPFSHCVHAGGIKTSRVVRSTCADCGATFVGWPPGLCSACAQKAYDTTEPVPMSEKRIQEIVDYAVSKEHS